MARTLVGTVSSDKADKTIVVAVHTRRTHPLYKKQYTVTQRYSAHDENNTAKIGDKVEIVECRPMSATKHFNLVKVVQQAGVTHTGEADAAIVEEVTTKAKEKRAEV